MAVEIYLGRGNLEQPLSEYFNEKIKVSNDKDAFPFHLCTNANKYTYILYSMLPRIPFIEPSFYKPVRTLNGSNKVSLGYVHTYSPFRCQSTYSNSKMLEK